MNPYATLLEQCETPRETEARLLRVVSRDLEVARDGTSPVELAQAVTRNRRMWTAFALDLAHEHNPLPAEIKAQLISIAGAVDRSCSDALLGDRAAIDAMVQINRNIAAALA